MTNTLRRALLTILRQYFREHGSQFLAEDEAAEVMAFMAALLEGDR